MSRDHWTNEEYRRFLETGKEPPDMPAASPTCCQRARQPSQDDIEKAWAKAEAEGRVMVLDISAERPKKNKYGNQKYTEDGINFDSKHEWNVYRWLKDRKERGELRWVFVHFPIRFMNGTAYWADFMTIRADGTVEAVWDAKSKPTAEKREYISKKKSLKAEWGIQVIEVFREDADGRGGFYNDQWFREW